jgi:FO synthase
MSARRPTPAPPRSAATPSLRRQPQHQLHQHLLLQVQVLRLLQGRPRGLRGSPYDLDLEEIGGAHREAWARGATEVCMQGGIHPTTPARPISTSCSAVKARCRRCTCMPSRRSRVTQGARTLGLPLRDLPAATARRRARHPAGHGRRDPRRRSARHHLPRQDQHRAMAGGDGAPRTRSACAPRPPSCSATSSTPVHWARHLLRLRDAAGADRRLHRIRAAALRAHGSAVVSQGGARMGPDLREAVLMHAVARTGAAPR